MNRGLPAVASWQEPSTATEVRVGDYRIIYRIDDGKVTVLVLVIGHRREVYDG